MAVAAATLAATVVASMTSAALVVTERQQKSGGEVGRWRVFELSMVITIKDLNVTLVGENHTICESRCNRENASQHRVTIFFWQFGEGY